MDLITLAIGKKIRKTEMENFDGQMESIIRDNTKTIRNMEWENSDSQMAIATSENGKTASNME